MPNPSYADLANNSETTQDRIKACLAIIASGMNPDGSANTAGGGGGAITMAASATGNPAKLEDAVAASGDSGIFTLAVRRDVDTANAANGDYIELQTDSLGALKVNSVERAATGTVTSVANSVASVTALAANSARRGAIIFNDDTAVTGAIAMVKLGAVAAAGSHTWAILPANYWVVPCGYTGVIDSIASAATGNLRVTELT